MKQLRDPACGMLVPADAPLPHLRGRNLSVRQPALATRAATLREDGNTVMFVAVDRKPAGLVAASDPVKDSAAAAIASLRAQGVHVAMVTGDDAVTARATLVRGDLRARALSRASVANVRQDPFLAFVCSALGAPIAADVLYPVTGWLLSPAFAAVAMALSSVSVIANALRLHRLPR